MLELGVQFPARDTYFLFISSLEALAKAKSIFCFLQKHLRAWEYQLKKLSLKYTFLFSLSRNPPEASVSFEISTKEAVTKAYFLFSLSRNHRQRGSRDQRQMLGPIFSLLKTSKFMCLLWRKRSYCKEYRGGWGCRNWTSDWGKDNKDNVLETD